MSKRTGNEGSGQKGRPSASRPIDEKRVVVEFTRSFDRNLAELPPDIQAKCRQATEVFLDAYVSRQFPKGLRVHKCGPFVSLSLMLNYRAFVLPIHGGVRFAFVGNHEDAERYLRKEK